MQHKGERKVKTKEEDVESVTESESTQGTYKYLKQTVKVKEGIESA